MIREWFGAVTAATFGRVREQLQRSLLLGAVAAFCSLLALCGLGFVAVGGYLSLREALAPWQAGLVVGGAALVLSLSGVLAAYFLTRRQGNTPQHSTDHPGREEAPLDSAADLGRAIGAGLARHGVHSTDVMLGALLAGTVLGASQGLRNKPPRRGRCSGEEAASGPERRTRRR